jgi:sugar phosphate isomerase/epimerase
MIDPTRRQCLLTAATAAACVAGLRAETGGKQPYVQNSASEDAGQNSQMQFGLVTYLWGADLGLKDLLQACSTGGLHGLELRTTHAHGVERNLSKQQRLEVRAQIQDTAIRWLGIGSDERFDQTGPVPYGRAIEASMQFIKLSHDVGGTGVKVKPDSFHKGVDQEQTIEQIGIALNTLGRYAAELGQEVRLEVHGGCAELPTIAAIMQVADHKNVAVCWNCNDQDLQGKGLAHNFKLVRPRFGQSLHCRAFDRHRYPYPELFKLLLATDYTGWVLLEARGRLPKDRAAAFAAQRNLFEQYLGRIAGTSEQNKGESKG